MLAARLCSRTLPWRGVDRVSASHQGAAHVVLCGADAQEDCTKDQAAVSHWLSKWACDLHAGCGQQASDNSLSCHRVW